MKKTVLAMAVLGAFAANTASAEGPTVSGFADITYTISDDGDDADSKANGSQFDAEGEIDLTATPADGVTVRIDTDLTISPGGGSADLEQAYLAWGVADNVTILGGLFNNPVGAEAEDAPDMWGTNHGVVWNLLDHQTVAQGDNVAGLAGAFGLGPVSLTVGILNDIRGSTDDGDGANSMVAVVNYAPMDGLDLELGHVTQEGETVGTHAGNVTNFNVGYTGVEGLAVGLDYLTGSETVDAAIELSAKYTLPMGLGFGLRLETVEWADEVGDVEDSERTTFHISYQVASNLTAIVEMADGDEDNPMTDVTGIAPEGVTTLELIATF